MDALPRFEEVAALGRKLVDEFGEDPPPDTLSGWMAHYIAELIDAATNAPAGKRAALRRQCFETILELWSHRADLPPGRRPFEDLEPMARALKSLDPSSKTPRFFASVRRGAADKEEGPQVLSRLEFVDGVDFSARIIIVDALADAARSALDKSREWVALAEAAGRNPPFVGIVTSFISKEGRGDDHREQVERERELLVDRIEKLEGFTELAAIVADDLKRRLERLAPQSEPSTDAGSDDPSDKARS